MMFFFSKEIEITKEVETEDGKKEKIKETKVVKDGFNLNKVLRVYNDPMDGRFIVVLDDGHEQAQEMQYPKLNAKGMPTGGVEMKRVRDWYISQIELEGEDIERFISVSEYKTKDSDFYKNASINDLIGKETVTTTF